MSTLKRLKKTFKTYLSSIHGAFKKKPHSGVSVYSEAINEYKKHESERIRLLSKQRAMESRMLELEERSVEWKKIKDASERSGNTSLSKSSGQKLKILSMELDECRLSIDENLKLIDEADSRLSDLKNELHNIQRSRFSDAEILFDRKLQEEDR